MMILIITRVKQKQAIKLGDGLVGVFRDGSRRNGVAGYSSIVKYMIYLKIEVSPPPPISITITKYISPASPQLYCFVKTKYLFIF